MNAQEMGYEWRITYESIASADAPGYTPREISIFLTEAEEDIVKEICKNGIDKNDYSRRVIGNLKAYSIVTSYALTNNPIRGYITETMPTDFFYPHIETIKHGEDLIYVKPESFEAIVNLKNSFRKPSATKFWRIFYNNNLLIVPPPTTTLDNTYVLNLAYIKKPLPIIIEDIPEDDAIDGLYLRRDCDLDPIVHRDIVYMAAKRAFAATKDQTGYQIQNIEENS